MMIGSKMLKQFKIWDHSKPIWMFVHPLGNRTWIHLYDNKMLTFVEDITEPDSVWMKIYRMDIKYPQIFINNEPPQPLIQLYDFLNHEDFHQ